MGWMISNHLQLMCISPLTASTADESTVSTRLGVAPVGSVRNIGIHLDADLTVQTHVMKTIASCFAALHQIRSIRWWSVRQCFDVLSLLLSLLDYGCDTLARLPCQLLDSSTLPHG